MRFRTVIVDVLLVLLIALVALDMVIPWPGGTTGNAVAERHLHEPFLAGRMDHPLFGHRLGQGGLEYKFKTTYGSAEQYLEAAHHAALQAGWRLITSSTLERIYRRRADESSGALGSEEVTIRYEPPNSGVHLISRPLDSH